MLYTTTPYFLALLHSPDSFRMMVTTYGTYFFFLPTIVSDFFAYSLARYDDLRCVVSGMCDSGCISWVRRSQLRVISRES